MLQWFAKEFVRTMATSAVGNNWFYREITLKARPRGFHLITDDVTKAFPEIKQIKIGILSLSIQHTTASITLNENWDAKVLTDMETAFNHIVPENLAYQHVMEGPDDITGHIKTALIGATLQVHVVDGHLKLGQWQGIYLCEHRDHGGSRTLSATLHGALKE